MAFTKRMTVPEKTDKRYIHVNYGGDYPGILGSPSYFEGSALANCVAYAYCRRQEIEKEITGSDKTRVGCKKGVNKPTSAYSWYGITTDGYERSKTTPQIGAVVVWKNNKKTSGHVAIVEDIAENGKDWILISESGMGDPGYVFRTSKIYPTYCMITNYNTKTGKYETSKHWNYKFKNGTIVKTDNTFLGYIYAPKTAEKTDAEKLAEAEKEHATTKEELTATREKLTAANEELNEAKVKLAEIEKTAVEAAEKAAKAEEMVEKQAAALHKIIEAAQNI